MVVVIPSKLRELTAGESMMMILMRLSDNHIKQEQPKTDSIWATLAAPQR